MSPSSRAASTAVSYNSGILRLPALTSAAALAL